MHFDQSEYHFGTSLIHFGVVIFGTSFILYSVILYPFRHGVCSIPGSIYSVVFEHQSTHFSNLKLWLGGEVKLCTLTLPVGQTFTLS